MSRAASIYAHAVRAELSQGWFEQPCATSEEAAALFDRLTRYEGVALERVENGRVVETRKGGAAYRLHQMAVRLPLAA